MGILTYSLMVETLLEILSKRSRTFYKPIDIHSVTDKEGKNISSISMQIIVNESGKHNFSCGRFFFWAGSKEGKGT